MTANTSRFAMQARNVTLPILPKGFLIQFRYNNCPQLNNFGHQARAKKLSKQSVYIDVDRLAATASLRYFGTPMSMQDSIEKEYYLWNGWLKTRRGGYLLVAPNTKGHSARLSEFSTSLGEAIALYLAEEIFNYPYSLFIRIGEKDPLGMDFAAKVKTGEVAIEAKSRKSWSNKTTINDIKKQFNKRTSAVEKYGFILHYQQGNYDKKKRSHVLLIDPPEKPVIVSDEAIYKQLQHHYYQISMMLGIWPLATILAERLGFKGPSIPVDSDFFERWKIDPTKHIGNKVKINKRVYHGHYFDSKVVNSTYLELDEKSNSQLPPYFFWGLDEKIIFLLSDGSESALTNLLKYTQENIRGYSFHVEGSFGELRYACLSDGVLRIDLTSGRQLTLEEVNVPPNIINGFNGNKSILLPN